MVELHDGRIYYNSRSPSGYYDNAHARELRPDEILRREAWSDDGGQTADMPPCKSRASTCPGYWKASEPATVKYRRGFADRVRG